MKEEIYKAIKRNFYSGGRYPELKELHIIFEFVDSLLVSGAEETPKKKTASQKPKSAP